MSGDGGRHVLVWALGNPHLTSCMVRVEALLAVDRSRNADGYGQVSWGGRSRLAHRVAFEAFLGPVPVGLVLDHFGLLEPAVLSALAYAPDDDPGQRLGDGLTARKARQTECR